MNKLILVLISLILLGCSLLQPDSPTETEDDLGDLPPRNPDIVLDEPITLEVWLDLDFTRNNSLFEEMAQDFEEVYPEVEVEIFSFVRESMPQRIKLEVQSGIPPDVVQGHVYSIAGQGLAEPLSIEWAQWEEDDPEIVNQFLPSAINEVTWQDVRYGVPLDVYTLVLLYNRDHFDEAGLTYPGGNYDLSTLIQAAVALSNPEEGRYGLGLTTDPWHVYAWVTAAGGDLLMGDPEKGYTLTLNSKTNVDVLIFLSQLVDNGVAPRPTSRPRDYEDARNQFINGQISMYFGEAQDIHLIQLANPQFPLGVAQLPLTPARDSAASVLGSSGLFIPRGARHQEVAFEFMKWASNDRYVAPMGRRLGRFPAKAWLRTSPEFTENLTLIPFFNQLDAAQPYRLGLFPEAEEAFSDAIKATFYDISSPTEALDLAQEIGQNSMVENAP